MGSFRNVFEILIQLRLQNQTLLPLHESPVTVNDF